MQRCELGPEVGDGGGRSRGRDGSNKGLESCRNSECWAAGTRLKSDESTHAPDGCPLGPRSSHSNTALHSLLTRSGLKYLNTSCSVVSRVISKTNSPLLSPAFFSSAHPWLAFWFRFYAAMPPPGDCGATPNLVMTETSYYLSNKPPKISLQLHLDYIFSNGNARQLSITARSVCVNEWLIELIAFQPRKDALLNSRRL